MMDPRIADVLEEARELERRARRLVLLARIHGAEAEAQAWVARLERDSAHGRSAVLARLEHGDLAGALGQAVCLAHTLRARGLDAYERPLEAMAIARRETGGA